MTTLTPENRDLLNGVAGQREWTIDPSAPLLLTGDVPAVFTTDELVDVSQTIPARTPVRFVSGKIQPAVSGSVACGITVYAVTTDSDDADVRVGVYRGGVFNPDALNWPASYNTAEKKRLAFEGAPSPTAIVIRKPALMNVT